MVIEVLDYQISNGNKIELKDYTCVKEGNNLLIQTYFSDKIQNIEKIQNEDFLGKNDFSNLQLSLISKEEFFT